MSKIVSVLGSTGSIGTQALDVARSHGYTVAAIAANKNVSLLEQQAREFDVQVAALMNENAAKDLRIRLADTKTRVLCGQDGILEAASLNSAEIVLNSIVGIAGLRPTMEIINAGKTLALANKESLVTGGDIVMSAAKNKKVKILPVDSEHSAIFQCLQGVPDGAVSKIILTASGGPFFGYTAEKLKSVTPSDALKHPNWDMGAKITIDSATLMNKGFEVMEAAYLFSIPADRVEVLVHRQSIVHSGVELSDGAVIAQLGAPDMRLPIQYAFTWPQRKECPGKKMSLSDIETLTFEKPDRETFRTLDICIDAVKAGGLKPAAVNGANEAAVALFLQGKIGFCDIQRLVAVAADKQKVTGSYNLDDVFAADAAAREMVLRAL